ncbi:hypothetical protein [Variovorax paradoxus]
MKVKQDLLPRIRLQALAGGPKADVIDEIDGWLVCRPSPLRSPARWFP